MDIGRPWYRLDPADDRGFWCRCFQCWIVRRANGFRGCPFGDSKCYSGAAQYRFADQTAPDRLCGTGRRRIESGRTFDAGCLSQSSGQPLYPRYLQRRVFWRVPGHCAGISDIEICGSGLADTCPRFCKRPGRHDGGVCHYQGSGAVHQDAGVDRCGSWLSVFRVGFGTEISGGCFPTTGTGILDHGKHDGP